MQLFLRWSGCEVQGAGVVCGSDMIEALSDGIFIRPPEGLR